MKPHPLVTQLIDERRALDLTRKDAALAAGIDRNTLDTLEEGARTPSLPTLEALARAFGFVVTLIHVGEKHCRTCGTTKPIRQFGRDRQSHDGLSSRCGTCVAANTPQAPSRDPDGEHARQQQLAPLAKRRAQITETYAKNLAAYANARRKGLEVAEAGEEVGVSLRTAQRYEVDLREQQTEVAA
jgi:DNA-binding XRE family transcriptional regulator